MSDELEPLSKRIPNVKHRRVIDKYFEVGLNQTRAYQEVYGCDYDVARSNAARLFAKANISEEIERRLKELAMSADEAIARMSLIAGSDISDYFKFEEGIKYPFLDLEAAYRAGKLNLVKKIKYDSNGKPEVELYPADTALRDILKLHGKFTDKLDITSAGEQIKFTFGGADIEEDV